MVGVSIGALVGAGCAILADSNSLWEVSSRIFRKDVK
ncbi:hypothetical protein [Mesotoga sp.]